MDNMSMNAGVEAVSGLFPAAWAQWGVAGKPGILSHTIRQFALKLGPSTNVPVENFRYMAHDMLIDPMGAAQRCIDMDKAFNAISPAHGEGSDAVKIAAEQRGRQYFLSRLTRASPASVTESWKSAEAMIHGKGENGAPLWPELQMWNKSPEGRAQLVQLTFSVATQLTLVRTIAVDCRKSSVQAAEAIFGEKFKPFLDGMLSAIRNDANQVERIFQDGRHTTENISWAMMTAIREAGDLRAKGMQYIVDNVLERAPVYEPSSDGRHTLLPPEHREEAMKAFLADPACKENMRLARVRVMEQKNLLFGEGLPTHDTRATSTHIMNRGAVLDGLSPLWAAKQRDKKQAMMDSSSGLLGHVDDLVRDIQVAAEVIAANSGIQKGREDLAFCAAAERFLRDVSRNALPGLVREPVKAGQSQQESVASLHEAHAEVLQNASEIALCIMRPDMMGSSEQVISRDTAKFSAERIASEDIRYAGHQSMESNGSNRKAAANSPE
jgi:hypothetical protein